MKKIFILILWVWGNCLNLIAYPLDNILNEFNKNSQLTIIENRNGKKNNFIINSGTSNISFSFKGIYLKNKIKIYESSLSSKSNDCRITLFFKPVSKIHSYIVVKKLTNELIQEIRSNIHLTTNYMTQEIMQNQLVEKVYNSKRITPLYVKTSFREAFDVRKEILYEDNRISSIKYFFEKENLTMSIQTNIEVFDNRASSKYRGLINNPVIFTTNIDTTKKTTTYFSNRIVRSIVMSNWKNQKLMNVDSVDLTYCGKSCLKGNAYSIWSNRTNRNDFMVYFTDSFDNSRHNTIILKSKDSMIKELLKFRKNFH